MAQRTTHLIVLDLVMLGITASMSPTAPKRECFRMCLSCINRDGPLGCRPGASGGKGLADRGKRDPVDA
jgi:hypothetical protein